MAKSSKNQPSRPSHVVAPASLQPCLSLAEPAFCTGAPSAKKLLVDSSLVASSLSSGPLLSAPLATNLTPSVSATLTSLTDPWQLSAMSVEDLQLLADEIRAKLIESVSQTGGHLSPSLGVVDLTVAMLSVFNPNQDKIIWDVGHQAYAYKLLTGRRDTFHTLRQFGGISGFPSRAESPYDFFGVGHSSTSISSALGYAVARDLAGESHHVVSVIGDGALTGGMAYEALNHAGANGKPFIVILNDNEMSISKNVGALSLFMSRNLSKRWVRLIKKEMEVFLKNIPGIGDDLYEIARRSKHSFKNFFTPGILFEAMRFNYIGAVNGHDIHEMQNVLRLAATQESPVLVHVLTQKGKGYTPAEKNPTRFHGIGPFVPETGEAITEPLAAVPYSTVLGDTLTALAEKDERIVAITAAMPVGTGLKTFAERFPDRFFDVGICEQHAITFAAGLACKGLKPFVAVYSTFMQRGYDQIIHDICLQNLPVTLCLDRAGLVGEDGATHHGAFDMGFLRIIPAMTCLAPANENEMVRGLIAAYKHNGPLALRYPRGSGDGILPDMAQLDALPPLALGEAEYLLHVDSRCPCKVAVLSIGSTVIPALQACQAINQQPNSSCGATLLNARWIKPLPQKAIKEIAQQYDKILITEEHSLAGGFSSAVLEFLADNGLLRGQNIQRLGLPDSFIPHGNLSKLRASLGLDAQGIEAAIKKFC